MITSHEARMAMRAGAYSGSTAGIAPGRVQANLVAVPRAVAFDFLLFAMRNPKPCPLIEIVEHGTEARRSAPGSDLRTDLPGYHRFANGTHVESAANALSWWRDDLVSFLIGCSFSFDAALADAGVPVRHVEMGVNVPMFITDRRCEPAGDFEGPLVVSMRPVPLRLVALATEITDGFPHAHGGPVHIGDHADLGLDALSSPDFGDAVPIAEDEVAMFWACGVTSQLALESAAPEVAITHEPGGMFVTDLLDNSTLQFNQPTTLRTETP